MSLRWAADEVGTIRPTKERIVRLRRGQTVLIDAGRGAQISVERLASGAVTLRNENTGKVLRQWAPKEARTP